MNERKIVSIHLFLSLMLFLILNLQVSSVANAQSAAVVKVDPQLIEYHTNATDQQFTIAVKIFDVISLYGFDIKFRWNTTYLEYVNHSAHVPRNNYPDGVLWEPYWQLKSEVYSNGTLWVAFGSYWPAPAFNGSGTAFTMTFRVKNHPLQQTVNLTLELYEVKLADFSANPIPHVKQDGKVILYALSSLGVGGINIPVDKFALLAPYIVSASIITIVSLATAIYIKRFKNKKQKR